MCFEKEKLNIFFWWEDAMEPIREETTIQNL